MIILLKYILEKDITEEETNSEKTNPETNDVGTGVASKLIVDSLKRVKCAQISIEVWPDKNKVAKGCKVSYLFYQFSWYHPSDRFSHVLLPCF